MQTNYFVASFFLLVNVAVFVAAQEAGTIPSNNVSESTPSNMTTTPQPNVELKPVSTGTEPTRVPSVAEVASTTKPPLVHATESTTLGSGHDGKGGGNGSSATEKNKSGASSVSSGLLAATLLVAMISAILA